MINWNGTIAAGTNVTVTFGAVAMAYLGPIANSVVILGAGETFTRTVPLEIDGAICGVTKAQANPILSPGPAGVWDSDAVRSPTVIKTADGYRMYYSGRTASGYNRSYRVGLATSPDGINWTRFSSNPLGFNVLSDWRPDDFIAGSVLVEGLVFKMWYTGIDYTGVAKIGYATSNDGLFWQMHPSGPVLQAGAAPWESVEVSDPVVIRDDATYHMWYSGSDGATRRIGHATSANGIDWVRDPANPVVDIGAPGAWNWLEVFAPSVVKVGPEYKLWYSGKTLPSAGQTGFALSSNGSAWTAPKMLLPRGPAGAFDALGAEDAFALVEDGTYRLWYTGVDEDDQATIGSATAEIRGPGALPASPVYLPLMLKPATQPDPCAAYYKDDFGNPASGWPDSENGYRRFAYVDGTYQMWVKQPQQGWSVTPGANVTDVTASVSGRRTAGTLGAYGIQFGIDPAWTGFYEFIVEGTEYSIWRYDGGGDWTVLKGWEHNGRIEGGTAWNRLKVVRNGANIAVYANGQLLTNVNDVKFMRLGRIALVTYSTAGSGVDARFDDFTLYPAGCGPTVTRTAMELGKPEVHPASLPPRLRRTR